MEKDFKKDEDIQASPPPAFRVNVMLSKSGATSAATRRAWPQANSDTALCRVPT